MNDTCVFCNRTNLNNVHGHHIVPRCKGGKEVQPTCEDCESFIHSTWSHNDLRDYFNTVDKIKVDERYQKFYKWLLKQKIDKGFRTLRNNDRAKGKYK